MREKLNFSGRKSTDTIEEPVKPPTYEEKGGEPLTFSATGKKEMNLMEKMFRSRTRAEEKEDSKLYQVLEGDISEIRRRLKIMYMADKERSENYIHGMVMGLDHIQTCLHGYLFDGELARLTLENECSPKKK